MNYWLLLIPFISAFIGWLTNWIMIKMIFHPQKPISILGIKFQGVYPKRQQQFAERVGKLVSTEFVSFNSIEQKISDPSNLQKIIPMIEKHVDDFLRVKLSAQMPFISAFIGDKTINSLKALFMQELQVLFPQVMTEFAGNLKAEFDPEQLIAQKISSFSAEKMEKMVRQGMAKELRSSSISAIVIGFIVGLFQLLIAVLTS
ncbi:MAG TPA: DUF445 family protein [Chitinophagaceae bacterium]